MFAFIYRLSHRVRGALRLRWHFRAERARGPLTSLAIACCVLVSAPTYAEPVVVTQTRVAHSGTPQRDVVDDTAVGIAPQNATATATGLGIAIVGLGDNDASATAQATASAIETQADDDDIARSIATNVNATSDVTGVAIAATLGGDSTIDTSLTATAAATGIDGGDDADTIRILGSTAPINVASNAEAVGVAIELTINGIVQGDPATADAVNESPTTATAASTGIRAGGGADRVESHSAIGAHATAATTAVQVRIGVGAEFNGDEVEPTNADAAVRDAAINDSAASATSAVIGIDGGDGDDTLDSSGPITLTSQADITAVSVALGIAGSVADDTESSRAASDSSGTADATLTGLMGGAGVDQLTNRSAITGDSNATGTAVGVSADIALTQSGDVAGNGLSDARIRATSDASGIDGGDDADSLTNLGALDLEATSRATSVAVTLDIAGTMEGGAEATATSNSSATAIASANGLRGGAGNDVIDNRGLGATIQSTANSTATGVSVGVTISGQIKVEQDDGIPELEDDEDGDNEVKGAATSVSSATAQATATSIDGGAGADRIINDANLLSSTHSVGTSVGASVGVAANVGVEVKPEGDVSGTTLSDASVTSTANSAGIDSGADNDDITNRGGVTSTAISNATGVAASLTIAGTVAYAKKEKEDAESSGADENADEQDSEEGDEAKGEAVANSNVNSTATAAGIRSGDGTDNVTNDGSQNVTATATATGVSAALSITAGVGINTDADVDVTGASVSDASVTASANAAGLDAGAGDDRLLNRAAANVSSSSTATGVAATLTLAGNVAYTAKEEKDEGGDGADAVTANENGEEEEEPNKVTGTALANSSVNASANMVAIGGGAGNDNVQNDGTLQSISANATATGVSAALTLAAGVGVNTDSKVDVTGGAMSNASVTAVANATALDGGDGDDTLTHSLTIGTLQSDATATGVAASLGISGSLAYEGKVSGNIEGEAVSDAATNSIATTTALNGGNGADRITSSGSIALVSADADAIGVAASLNVAAGVAIKGDAEDVNVTGRAVSDTSVSATARAVAFDGGAGADEFLHTGHVTRIEALSNATGVAASLDVTGTLSYKGDTSATASGQAVSDSSVASTARAAAIDGGGDADTITNRGNIDAIYSEARSVGVAASLGATATVTVQGDSDTTVEGHSLSRSQVVSTSSALGIDGGAGNDTINNETVLPSVRASAITTGVAASLNVAANVTVKGSANATVTGEAMSDTSARADAVATSIGGGADDDTINNRAALNVLADSNATGIAATLGVTGSVTFQGSQEADSTGDAASDTSVTATARATGIDGGSGVDVIDNTGAIGVMSNGSLANTNTTTARALGVAATLNVVGNLAIKGVSSGDVSGTAASDSRVTAEAVGIAIDGGDDNDRITNSGVIVAAPVTKATGVSATLQISGNMGGDATGSALSETSVVARTATTGIAGGAGNDTITNNGGRITLLDQVAGNQTDAMALGVAVSATIAGTVRADVESSAISNAQTLAAANAIGVDGGAGDDQIDNSGVIGAHVDAVADAVSVSVNVGVTPTGDASGSALADARAIADSTALGLAGGDGGDIIANKASGNISLISTSDAQGTAVSVGIAVGGFGVEGEAAANASTHSNSRAVAIDGGAGGDDIDSNSESIATHAQANSDSLAVTVNVTAGLGLANNSSVTDASANATALSSGVDGGSGIDQIDNTSRINATAASTAEATSTNVVVALSAGAGDNVGTGNASATALAVASGIAGGDDGDTITNSAAIVAGNNGARSVAQATSGSTTVGVTLGVGYTTGDMSAASASLADATVLGIDGGSGIDTITNHGDISVANSTALNIGLARSAATSTTVNVGLTAGYSEGASSADGSATAIGTVVGIEGGAGGDTLNNTATIRAGAAATGATAFGALMTTATAGSTTVDVGISAGSASQDAASNSSATAMNSVAGIAGGDDDDTIDNTGDLFAYSSAGTLATSETTQVKVSLGVTAGTTSADASAHAIAIGAGIDGGGGDDTITTDANIDVRAFSISSANSSASSVSALSLGAAIQDAQANSSAESRAEARGVFGGAGADEITVGAVDADDAAPATRTFDVNATSWVASLARSSTVSGFSAGSVNQQAQSNSSTQGHALAVGIDSGVGDDGIISATAMTITANTGGSSTGTSSANTGFALGGVTSSEALANASTNLTAEAVGIRGGDAIIVGTDVDDITAVASIDVTATASGTSSSTATSSSPLTFAGAADGSAVADASATIVATATGIEAGADDDTIVTQMRGDTGGTIDVNSEANAVVTSTATSAGTVVFGNASSMGVSDASAVVNAESLGIDGGSGGDTITSNADIHINSHANANVTATSEVSADVTFGAASTGAASDASVKKEAHSTGIDAGDGADTITNNALLNVEADVGGSLSSTARDSGTAVFRSASSNALARSALEGTTLTEGILGGGGNDTITNVGTLNSHATSEFTVTSLATSYARSTFSTASASASSIATAFGSATALGVLGDAGNDTIENRGTIDSIAIGNTTVTTTSIAVARTTFGSANTNVQSSNVTQGNAFAGGIDGGDGIDTLSNSGLVHVDASSDVTLGRHTLSSAGPVNADASAIADAFAFGMRGGAGRDGITNSGTVNVVASNDVQIGSYDIGSSVNAILRTTTDVEAIAFVGESVDNSGMASATADTHLRADSASITARGGASNQGGQSFATAHGILGDASLGNSATNSNALDVNAVADVRSTDRVLAWFGTSRQELTFAATGDARAVSGGAANDIVTNEVDGDIEVHATGAAAIQGVSTTFRIASNLLRTENLVNATVDTSAYGFELGAGTNTVTNGGSLIVRANATPADVPLSNCGTHACLALAVANRNGETSASANALATARAWGILGNGSDHVSSLGSIEVTADALATSFAQAATVSPVQDQSGVTSIEGERSFIDRSLQGLAPELIEGKRIRFPGNLDLDFLAAESTVGSIRTVTQNNVTTNSNQFTDTTYDGDDPIGMRVRFADAAGSTFTVTGYNPDTHEFTLSSVVPNTVAATEGYSLSLLAAEVQSFDSATGRVTLTHALPAGVNAGGQYSLSIVSAIDQSSFTDSGRIGDDIPVNTLVTFQGVNGFAARVLAFDSDTGTFTLDRALPTTLAEFDVYSLSVDQSDGHSGADGQAFASGIQLGDGGGSATVGGTLTVRASAIADTRSVANAGASSASVNGVADAVGIHSGIGNDVIVNNGRIDVRAELSATSSTTNVTHRVAAIGIDSGAGNDLITQNGELIATALWNGAQAEAIAIRSGEGNDRVTLGATSHTAGNVEMNDGDDALTFNGGARLEGIIDAGSGIDRLTLNGTGGYTGTLVSFEQLTKNSVGTFTLAQLPTVTQLAIDAGTLRIDNRYDFGATSVYAVPIAGDGSHGRLSAVSAQLAGTLTVARQAGPFLNGTTFDIVTTDQGIAANSTFNEIRLPEATALVGFRYQQSANAAQVVADVASFGKYAGDPVQQALTEYLDRLLPQAQGELRDVIEHLQLQKADALPPSYTAMSAMQYGAMQRLTLDSVTQQMLGLQHHMSTLRLEGLSGNAGHRGSYATGTPVLLAQLDPRLSLIPAINRDAIPKRAEMWADFSGSGGRRDADSGFAGYDVDNSRYTVGFDLPLSSQWLIGLSVGRSDNDVDFNASDALSDQEFDFYTLYGSWISKSAYIDTSIVYGSGEQNDARPVNIVGLPNRLATSDHGIDVAAASVEGAYVFGGETWSFGPTAALRYMQVNEDAFIEDGAGALSLSVAERSSNALLSDVGVRVWRTFTPAGRQVVPEAALTWVHDFDIDDGVVDAAFSGTSTQGFATPVERGALDGARITLGIGFVGRSGFSTLLRYTGEFRGGLEWHGVQGQLRYEF